MLDVKKIVKELTVTNKIRINDLAKSLDMTPQSLSNWLYRPDSPKVNTTERILAEFGCRLAIVDDDTNEILF